MTPAADWLDNPNRLCAFLHGRGLRVGTGEALRVGAVLDELGRSGRKPRTPEEAMMWLSPVICTTAAQQALLPRIMSEFASLHLPVERVPEPAPAPSAPEPPSKTWLDRLLQRPLVAVALVMAGVLLLIGILAALGTLVQIPRPTVPTTDKPALPKLALPEWDWSWLQQGWRFALVPVGFWLVFYQWYRRRPVVLQRARSREEPQAKRLLGDDAESRFALFGAADLRQPLQAMRAHRLAQSPNYDFPQSVRATSNAGGYPTLVREMRPLLPEYPIIIEQLSGKDHVAALGRALAQRLSAERVAATTYTFSTDPRILRGDPRRLLGLGDLLNRHGDETIILVSDGETLIDPLTGTANPSVAEFAAWANPVLLTPVPLQRWSHREKTLAEAGLLVFPATPEGLELLSQKLAGNVEAQSPLLRGARSNVRRDSHAGLAWHHDEPMPSPDEREEILDAIAAELPAAAFELLCVLARFPEVRLDLTLHMGLKLKRRNGKPLLDEESFGALAWLPWMRLGRIPDWLRLDLVHCLSEQRQEEARKLYDLWLAPALAGQAGELLEIAHRQNAFTRLLRRHVTSDRTTPLRDVIFLKSQRGESVSDLDLRAPDELRRLLRPAWFELEWISGAVALVLAVAAFVFAPELQAGRGLFFKWNEVLPIFILFAPAVSILIWHLAAYLARWRTWLSALIVLSGLFIILTIALLSPTKAQGEGPFLALVLFALPGFILALTRPSTGVSEQAQPTRKVLVSDYALVATVYIAIWSAVQHAGAAHGLTVMGCGSLVVAFVLSRMIGIPYAFSAVGTFLGGLCCLYPSAVLIFGWKGRIGDEAIASILQIAFLTALYGALLTAVLLRRIHLTRFLIIAWLGVTVISAGAAVEVWLRDDLANGTLWSAYFPVVALCLILTYIALVRPEAMRSRVMIRWCVAFAFVVTVINYLAGMISLPLPIWKTSSADSLTWFSVPIGAAAQFLFVPGAIAVILAGLDRADAVARNRESVAAPLWRVLADVYIPPVWMAVVPLLWLLGMRYPLFGSMVGLPLLFIPAAATLGAFYGSASLSAVLFGGLPLLVAAPVGPFELIGNPGIFLAGILVHQLFADPRFRTRCLFATSIEPLQLIALVVLLGSTYRFGPFAGLDFALGGSLQLALFYVMFVLGASRIAIGPVVICVVTAGAVGLALNLAPQITVPGTSVSFGPAELRQVTSALAFLLLGRFFFHRQLPSLLRPSDGAANNITVRNRLFFPLLFLAILSHVEIRYGIAGRTVTDGLVNRAVLQPLIFMLGFLLGPHGVLLAFTVLFVEFLPSMPFMLGIENRPPAAAFAAGGFQFILAFNEPLAAVLSRLEDLAMGVFGWRVMVAFSPDRPVNRNNEQRGSEAPLRKAA